MNDVLLELLVEEIVESIDHSFPEWARVPVLQFTLLAIRHVRLKDGVEFLGRLSIRDSHIVQNLNRRWTTIGANECKMRRNLSASFQLGKRGFIHKEFASNLLPIFEERRLDGTDNWAGDMRADVPVWRPAVLPIVPVVGNAVAANECNLSIDNHDLAVIAHIEFSKIAHAPAMKALDFATCLNQSILGLAAEFG